MKSFSEYIRESVDFRLGGKRQNGFEQNNAKSFAELKKGDVFYLWTDTGPESCECTLIADPFPEKNDNVLYLDVNYNRHYIWLDDTNKSCSYCDSKMTDSIWAVATSFEELYDVVEDKFGVKIDKNKMEKE